MTLYRRTSTPSLSAISFALASGLMLKPITMAFDADARIISDSLIAPTPACMHLITTSSFESFKRLCLTASTEPCTSALMMILSSLRLPAWIWLYRSSSDILCFVSARSFSLPCEIYVSDMVLASFSLSTAMNISPASGTVLRPWICTGVDGRASVTLSPLELVMARTLPCDAPTAM